MIKIIIVLGVGWLLFGCTVMDFSCSYGQYGPRAAVTYSSQAVLGVNTLEELKMLCAAGERDA